METFSGRPRVFPPIPNISHSKDQVEDPTYLGLFSRHIMTSRLVSAHPYVHNRGFSSDPPVFESMIY